MHMTAYYCSSLGEKRGGIRLLCLNGSSATGPGLAAIKKLATYPSVYSATQLLIQSIAS